MIVEFRTYRLKPGSSPRPKSALAKASPNRTKVSPLGAFWHTEVGPLNRIIHVWPYEDFAHRARRSARRRSRAGRPTSASSSRSMKSEIFIPAPFSPKLEPRQLGGIYEIRTYTLAPGAIPGQIDRWCTAIAERVEAVAVGLRRPFRARRAQPLAPHLGLQGRQPPRRDPRQGAEGRHLAAEGRAARPDPDPGEHAGRSGRVLAAEVALKALTRMDSLPRLRGRVERASGQEAAWG